MERESTSNQSSSTSSCKMGCGFYGSSSFEGYCSKCYQGVVDSRVEKQCSNGSSSNGVSNRSGSPIVASDGQTPFNKNGIPVPSRSQTSFSPTSLLQEKSSSLTVSRRSSNKDIALSGEDQASALMDIDEELAATAAGEATSTTVDGNQSPSRGASTDAAPSGYQQPTSDNSAFAGTNENNHGANKNDPVLFPVGTTATADTSLAADSTALANLSMASASSGAESADGGEKSSKKRRCAMCRKKVGLTGFDCRCGGLFCTEHRYADSHACEFDYKSMEREGIRKANPVVAAEKIRKF